MDFFAGAMLMSSCILSQNWPSMFSDHIFPNTTHCDCGMNAPAGLKIVGGQMASKNHFPWQVALLRAEYRPMGIQESFFCAAVIITAKYILSAAHCAADRCVIIHSGSHGRYMFRQGSTIALFGVHDLKDPSAGPSKELQVINVAIHHQYDPETFLNDIALLQLCKLIDFGKWPTIRPACLPPPDLELQEQNVTVIGWGSTREKGPISSVLQEITIPVVNQTECRDHYKNVSVDIADTVICAGEAGKDSCQGDSGGPMHFKCSEGHYVVGGIVSFGMGCAQKDYPGVYTKVTDYLDWISKRTRFEACHVKCNTN